MTALILPSLHATPMNIHHASLYPGIALRVVWLVRWLLVLALVWGQAFAPFHSHAADTEVGAEVHAQWTVAGAHDEVTTPHLEGRDSPVHGAHAVLAVRPKASAGALVPVGDPGDWILQGHSGQGAGLAPHSQPVRAAAAPEPRRTYRSLPPAGRAPPAQA